VQRENQTQRAGESSSTFEFYQRRRALLPLLDESVIRLKNQRTAWQRLAGPEKAQFPEIAALIRANQELINRVLLMDRENEQMLLRRGLIPPKQIPSVAQQRPHFVAELYRRNIGK
jgi:hypothetical protein